MSHSNPVASSLEKPTNASSLNGQQIPTKQSSLQTEDHVTQRVSHVNKLAEFYVSISPAPRTTPIIHNKDIKHIENTPSQPIDSISDSDKYHFSNIDQGLLSVEKKEGNIDNPYSSDNTDIVPYSEETGVDFSRSNDRYGEILETDDEDLLAGMGSGYSRPPIRHHDRFAFEHDMEGAFAGSNNIYEHAEKVGTEKNR